jgi:hypothetical protein
MFAAYNPTFGIYGFGESERDAVSDFKALFIDYYEDIVNTSDDELPDSSLRVKKTLSCFATLVYGE